jgi:hypothetical protein
LALREIKQEPKGAIHGFRIPENFSDIGIKQHNVRAGSIPFEMLSPDPAREIVFGSHLFVVSGTLIHTLYAPLGLHLWH